MTYAVEVDTATHDDLAAGKLAVPRRLGGPPYTVVYVSAAEARSDVEALLIACQIAACTSGGMPTAARLISWPTEWDTP